ncbi:integrase catalytic region domain protein, partial [Acinetobacter sp. 1566109]
QLCIHLADFIAAYNFGRRLKTLRSLTPYEFICKQWTDEPELFKIDPIHQMPGLNIFKSRLARFSRCTTCDTKLGRLVQ